MHSAWGWGAGLDSPQPDTKLTPDHKKSPPLSPGLLGGVRLRLRGRSRQGLSGSESATVRLLPEPQVRLSHRPLGTLLWGQAHPSDIS